MADKLNEIIRKNRLISYLIMLMLGLFLGWILFAPSSAGDTHEHSHDAAAQPMYTCSMHPQIKQDHPGKCPICGMDLIPMQEAGAHQHEMSSDAVMMSDESMALADIRTQVVGTGIPTKEVRLYGKVEPDQNLQQSQSAYVSGRIERLNVNAIGDYVTRGSTLAVIYAPELYSAEQDLLAALDYPDKTQAQALIEAAKEKLRLLNVPQTQIDEVITRKKASPYITLVANTSGTVISKNVQHGDYVKQGQELFKITDLSRVWGVFQAYEKDLPFISVGSTIGFTSEAMPGDVFTGKVSFVDPVLNPKTRTAAVRIEIPNSRGLFKPEMLLTGDAAIGMKEYDNSIVIPKSAVLWTGKRSIVYVQDESEEQPTFEMRVITLGPSLADSYIVADGLAEGEIIVTHGAFVIDASAQLGGQKSMMNQ